MAELEEQMRSLVKEHESQSSITKAEKRRQNADKQESPSKLVFMGGFTPKKSTNDIVHSDAIETTFTPIRRQRVGDCNTTHP